MHIHGPLTLRSEAPRDYGFADSESLEMMLEACLCLVDEVEPVEGGQTKMADIPMSIEVHGEIAKAFAKEYVEAVIADAMEILPSYVHRKETLVVVNPRHVAVLLDIQAKRGAVIPLDMIQQVIDGPMKTRLETWLASPATPFYVMHMAGSWFAGS